MLGSPHGTPATWRRALDGAPLDARSDLYALGCISFELVTGRPPFKGDEPAALRAQHLTLPAPSAGSVIKDVPEALGRLIAALLEKDPRSRVGFADDVVAELDRLSDVPAPSQRRQQVPCLFSARFVGRSEIRARLRQRLDGVRVARGGCVFLTGESGIGKTRLANELCAWALASGSEVITTSSQNAGGSELGGVAALQLFAPCLQALDDVVRVRPELCAELEDACRCWLSTSRA